MSDARDLPTLNLLILHSYNVLTLHDLYGNLSPPKISVAGMLMNLLILTP